MAGPVKAYMWAQGTTAAVVGPARSRVKQIVVYGAAAGSFTIKNGSATGTTLLTQDFPAGLHTLNIPGDGILAEDGVFVSAFTGTNNDLTFFLA